MTTTTTTLPAMDAEREFISVRPTSTEIVMQIFVPRPGDFGILAPAPAQPTIDPTPVPTDELELLDSSTRPQITVETTTVGPIQPRESGGGFGCGGAAAKGSGRAGDIAQANSTPGVRTGQPVTVGPVTATPLTASDGAALNAWLAQNGFVIPADKQALVDGYVGPGKWFIAFKPSGQNTAGVSVAVHYSFPAVEKDMELHLAQLGAVGDRMAFTVFVVAPEGVSPSTGRTLTLDDLPGDTLAQDYAGAVAQAVTAAGGDAWLVEGVLPTSVVPGSLKTLVDPASHALTRLSTVRSAAQLGSDASFDGPPPGSVPTQRTVKVTRQAWLPPLGGPPQGPDQPGRGGDGPAPGGPTWAALLCLALLWRTARRPALAS